MMKINFKNGDFLHLTVHKTEDLVAAVGRRSCVVMHFSKNSFEVIQQYLDEEKEENLMSAQFTTNDGEVILCVGGGMGIIKILNITRHEFYGFLHGHGGGITQICSHPRKETVIFSSSEDTTVRMWCLVEKRCLAIFGGYIGHRDYVLSVDVSRCGNFMLSAGTDTRLKVWKIPEKVENKVNSVYFPIYSTTRLHKSYITCAKFCGDLIVSRSAGNRIVFVKPDYSLEIYNQSANSDSFFIDEFKPSKEAQFTQRFFLDDYKLVACVHKNYSEIVFLKLSALLVDSFVPYKTIKLEFGVRDVVFRDNNVFILYKNSDVEYMINTD